MKKIIFLLLILSSGLVKADSRKVAQDAATPAPMSELKKKFLEQTKIEVGDYVATPDSDPQCLDGPLDVVDVGGEYNELNIMLGARSLAGSLGRDKYSEKEEDCTITYETSYNSVAIKERIEKECKGVKTVFHTNVTLAPGRISYVKEAYDGEKLVDTAKCSLTKVEPAKKETAPAVQKKPAKKVELKKSPKK